MLEYFLSVTLSVWVGKYLYGIFFPYPILLSLEVLETPSQVISPVCDLKLPTHCTLGIYSFPCNRVCPCLIQPVHLVGVCMDLHFHPLTPAVLLARLWLWRQEVPSAFLCLLDSFLPNFCCTLLNHMLPNGSRCCPLLVFSTYFYLFGLRSYTRKWLQQWGEVAVPVSSFRTRAPFPLPKLPGLPCWA